MMALQHLLRLNCPCMHQCRHLTIGSFHSENPEDLLRIPNDLCQPPPLPFDVSSATTSNDHFMLDKSWTFLNHGAFGASLKMWIRSWWRYYLEQQPLRYFDRDLLPHLVYSTQILASFMHTSPSNVALLPNVTNGLNTVVQGCIREYKDASRIVLWETSYRSVKKMARTFCENVYEISFLSQLRDISCYR